MIGRRSTVRHSVIGLYADVDSLIGAVKLAREANLGEIRTISPVPLHEVEEVLGKPTSPVRMFVLAGGLLGLVIGWALTIGSSMHYPLIVGGKPLISLTPFAVIAYICTILFGALFTVAGMMFCAGLPRLKMGPGYDPRLTGNRFGLQIFCDPDKAGATEARLLESGAEEVLHVEA